MEFISVNENDDKEGIINIDFLNMPTIAPMADKKLKFDPQKAKEAANKAASKETAKKQPKLSNI